MQSPGLTVCVCVKTRKETMRAQEEIVSEKKKEGIAMCVTRKQKVPHGESHRGRVQGLEDG